MSLNSFKHISYFLKQIIEDMASIYQSYTYSYHGKGKSDSEKVQGDFERVMKLLRSRYENTNG